MNIRTRVAHKQDPFSGFYACIHFGRKYKTTKRIPQGDEVNVNRHQQARKLLERNKARSKDRQSARAKFSLNIVGPTADGIEPKPQALLGLPAICGICVN